MPAKRPNKKVEKKNKNMSVDQQLIDQLQQQYEELEAEKVKLEKNLVELQETTKRAQYDYVNLKMDFDRYRTMQEQGKESQKLDLLLDTVKKFLPFVENLRKSLENISEEVASTQLGQGVSLVYKSFLSTLETMYITPIKALGEEPDNMLHEPVSMQPVDDKKLKGKIIQEFERGFVYQNGDIQKVVSTSKVVVGQ